MKERLRYYSIKETVDSNAENNQCASSKYTITKP